MPKISFQLKEKHTYAKSTTRRKGQLAYIGNDGNVYVTRLDTGSTIAITDDAEVSPEGFGLSYHRLAWSPDGWLAFAAVTRGRNEASGTLYFVKQPGDPVQVVAESDKHFFSYIYWSPVTCPGRPYCHRLAYLIREDHDIGLHLVEIDENGVEDRLVVASRPIFFSWSTDGTQMLLHTGDALGEDPNCHLAQYDLEQDQSQILTDPTEALLTADWSSIGGKWLSIAMNREQLINDNTDCLPSSLENVVFSAAPAGNQIAFAMQETGSEGVYGPIHIYNLRTGEIGQITDDPFRILGFFWAPDGQQIGYLTHLNGPQTEVWAQWRVFDLAKGEDHGFAVFRPSPWVWFMLSGFHQHAQSHRFWSPDGRYLVYAEREKGLRDRVMLVDTRAEKGAPPIEVGEGIFGVWSQN